jgi:hypothetical protein
MDILKMNDVMSWQLKRSKVRTLLLIKASLKLLHHLKHNFLIERKKQYQKIHQKLHTKKTQISSSKHEIFVENVTHLSSKKSQKRKSTNQDKNSTMRSFLIAHDAKPII